MASNCGMFAQGALPPEELIQKRTGTRWDRDTVATCGVSDAGGLTGVTFT